jgi:integrase
MRTIASLYEEEHELSVDYARALRRVATSLELFGITPSTLDSSSLNHWLACLPQCRTTKSNYLRMAKTLIAFAARKGFGRKLPDGVRKVKPENHPVVAWTHADLRMLMATAEKLDGTFRSSGCPRSLFWQAWILVGYETCLRHGDLHHLMANQLRGDRLYVVHHKTGVPQGKVLSAKAVGLVRDLAARGDGSVFRWALSRKHIFIQFRALVREAGMQGSTKFLRRSGATHSEIARPGSAKQLLGHLSDGLAMKHYIDQTLLSDTIPQPPPFMECSS